MSRVDRSRPRIARRPSSLIVAGAIAAAVVLGSPRARAGEMPHAIGMYTPANTQLALVDSKIEVTVRGPIVEAVVTQKFVNRTERPTEATYVFPLPVDAAVTAMSIEAGSKKIHAAIERREQAQQRYEAAVRAGVAGALLDQERPDVFTQTVAAVPARGTVSITLRFDTVARYQDDTWELALPLVVAPRYVPGAATNRPTTGTGRSPDTDRAPDASRITPANTPGAGGATEVVLRFSDKVSDLTSPTHELKVGANESTFTDPKTDHDAIIRWKTAGTAAGWVEQAPDGGFAAIVVEAPPAAPRRGTLRWTLVLDRSAATRGDAEAASRPVVRGLFAAMSSSDRVAVTGSDQLGWGSGSDAARAIDERWSTNAGPFDLTRAFGQVRPEGAPVVLVSGGLVADDRAAVAAAVRLGVPVHVIGIGPAPARGVLSQIAAATGGTVRFATPGDDLAALAKAALADLASAPAPLTVTWGTLQASEVVPGTLPRLGAGQAAIVLARIKQVQTAANGRARGELFAIEPLAPGKPIAGAVTQLGPLARRWARNRLDELIAARAAPGIIAAHALRYGLVSPYTSMVAVGDEVVVQGGVKRSIAVPVSVPAGMKWQQVKKETTVDRTSNLDAKLDAKKGEGKNTKEAGYATKSEDKPATKPERNTGRRPTPVAKTEPTPKPPPKRPVSPASPTGGITIDSDTTQNIPRPERGPAGDDDGEESNTRRGKAKKAADEADVATALDAAAGADEDAQPAPRAMSGETLAMVARDGGIRRRWRLAGSLGGGVVRARGEAASLLTGGARLEFAVGRRTLAGLDTGLWLVDGDQARGQVLVSFAVLGIQRWLELGLGFGFQFGDGAGPAGALSLRLHLPPVPRASLFLRYDGGLLYDNDTRRGQSSGMVGVEWGF